MSRLGFYKNTYTLSESSDINSNNIVVLPVTIPADGWISHIGVSAGGKQSAADANLILLDSDGDVVASSPLQSWNSVVGPRAFALAGEGLKVKAGEQYRVGFRASPNTPVTFSEVTGGKHLRTSDSADILQANYAGFVEQGVALGAWIDLVENVKPRRGTWREVPVGKSPNTSYTVEGNFLHDSTEGGRDSATRVQIRIHDNTWSVLAYTHDFDVTAEENAQGFFSRTLAFPHPPGHEFWIEWRYMDEHGQWSDFSLRSYYSVSAGPYMPSVFAPTGKLNWITAATSPQYESANGKAWIYRGSYFSSEGAAMSHAQVEVRNKTRTKVVFNSGKVAIGANLRTVLSGTEWHMAMFHGNFSWNAEYSMRFKTWGTNGKDSEWSKWRDFKTNTAPFTPSDLTPAGGVIIESALLSCVVRDKDGDDLSWVKFQVTDLTTGLPVAGHPVTINGPHGSGTRVQYDATPDLTRNNLGQLIKGRGYSWVAWTSDGILESPQTAPRQFIYDTVPKVFLNGPQFSPLRNLVANPSIEQVGDATNNWVTDNASGAMRIERVRDAAIDGLWSMEAERTATTPTGGYIRSKPRPATNARSLVAYAWIIRKSGAPNTTVQVIFRNSGGSVVGTYIPTDINGGLNAAQPATVWTRYGGIVPKASIPATTATAQLEIIPSASGIGRIRFDDAFLAAIEAPTVVPGIIHWFGYFDGDRVGYGVADSFVWDSEDTADATSTGVAVLTEPVVSVIFNYSTDNAPKAKDRLRLEEWDRTQWKQVYDSGLINTNRTSVPIPSSIIRNQRRYRVRVTVEDTVGLSATTEWIEFDTEFEGPAPLNVLSVGQDSTKGTLTISWEPSLLDPLEFVATEVSVLSAKEGEVRVARIPKQEITSYTYHFPRSGVVYDIRVRQVQIVGPEQVESRWSGGTVNVDYWPYFFLKSVYNPEVMIAFDPERGKIPGRGTNTQIDEYIPIHQGVPRHIVSKIRFENGSFEASLWDDPELPYDAYEYLELAKTLDKDVSLARFACFMGHLPSTKNFVVLKDIQYGTDNFLEPVITVEWSDTLYEEDVLIREGEAQIANG